MPELRLYFLGYPRIELDGVVIEVNRRKVLGLLTYLAITNTSHSRETLTDLLYPELDVARAKNNLRQTLSHLKSVIGDKWLSINRKSVTFSDQAESWIDVHEFASLANDTNIGCKSEEARAERLEKAITLYKNNFLEGFYLKNSFVFEEWQLSEQAALRESYANSLKCLANLYRERDSYEKSILYTQKLVDMDPLSEPTHQELIRLYGLAGNKNGVIRQYERCKSILKTERSALPSVETEELYERTCRERTLSHTNSIVRPPRRGNLPSETTTLIGRERDISRILSMLKKDGVRLLTLAGSAGVGKTRLALRIGTGLIDEYEDRIFFVPLETVVDPNLVFDAVIQILGIFKSGDQTALKTLEDYFGDRRMLIILDNFEQVISAAPMLSSLLMSCPNLMILVTSREVLRLRAESVARIPPLALPEKKAEDPLALLGRHSAIRLFVERARAVDPDFSLTNDNAQTVVDICVRLDGLPLAIELAAARISLMTPREVLQGIVGCLPGLLKGGRDVPERQRTLEHAIGWSYNILDEDEKRLFRRLSVFAGGCTMECAIQVCGGDGKFDVLNSMAALVGKCLINHVSSEEGSRYVLLHVIREYALARQRENGEEIIFHNAMAQYYLSALREAPPYGARTPRWVRWELTERVNLFHAVEWCFADGDAMTGCKLVAKLGPMWRSASIEYQGIRWTDVALEHMGLLKNDLKSILLRQKAGLDFGLDREKDIIESYELSRASRDNVGMAASLFFLAELEIEKGNHSRAMALLDESSDLSESAGDETWKMWATYLQGVVQLGQKSYKIARGHFERSLTMSKNNLYGRGAALSGLARVESAIGDPDRAIELYEESKSLLLEIGDFGGTPFINIFEGRLLLRMGTIERSRELFAEALAGCRDLGSVFLRPFFASCLIGLAAAFLEQDRYEKAAILSGALMAFSEENPLSAEIDDKEDFEGVAVALESRMDYAELESAREKGRSMSMNEVISYALEDVI